MGAWYSASSRQFGSCVSVRHPPFAFAGAFALRIIFDSSLQLLGLLVSGRHGFNSTYYDHGVYCWSQVKGPERRTAIPLSTWTEHQSNKTTRTETTQCRSIEALKRSKCGRHQSHKPASQWTIEQINKRLRRQTKDKQVGGKKRTSTHTHTRIEIHKRARKQTNKTTRTEKTQLQTPW